MKFFKVFTVVLSICFLFVACSSRMPSPKTARSAAMSYFKRYGRKYPHTQFGNKNVSNVNINAIEEISYKFALVDTIITFNDGHAARALARMESRFPGGWRVISWEMITYQ